MAYKKFKWVWALLAGVTAACSEQGPASKADTYVTNAEYVLERIEQDSAATIAFQVNPVRKTACEYMYLEIGKKSENGQWATSNRLHPGKDARNKFGQNDLKDQVHFAEVNGEGEYGVLALGCKPYGRELNAIRGLIATFDVEPGKLNYIGEVALAPVVMNRREFSKVEIADRTEFALEQIQTQLPALATHFHPNMMKKFEVEISPEQRAKMDNAAKELEEIRKKSQLRMENANRIIEARNRLVPELKTAIEALDAWDEANGYPKKQMTDRQYDERRKFVRAAGSLTLKIEKYDDWIERDISFPLTQQYMKLERSADRASRLYTSTYPDVTNLSREDMKHPEFQKLLNATVDADAALSEFAKRHGL